MVVVLVVSFTSVNCSYRSHLGGGGGGGGARRLVYKRKLFLSISLGRGRGVVVVLVVSFTSVNCSYRSHLGGGGGWWWCSSSRLQA